MTIQPVLTQDEKLFLDKVPDGAVKKVLESKGTAIKISYVPNDLAYTEYYEFTTPERAKAVRDYYYMMIDAGVRQISL